MEEKKLQLIKLVLELGSFFSNCDDDCDQREMNFITNYINSLINTTSISDEKLHLIEKSIVNDLNIYYLIKETRLMCNNVDDEEKYPLLKTLSYFINNIILADGIIHPNEIKYYSMWKKELELDDDINIEMYL